MNKKFCLLFSLIIILGLSACTFKNEPSKEVDRVTNKAVKETSRTTNPEQYFCEVDTDCSIQSTECGCCASAISCINTDLALKCPKVNCEAFSCLSPAPPWFDNCKCINNTCANCRGDDCKTE